MKTQEAPVESSVDFVDQSLVSKQIAPDIYRVIQPEQNVDPILLKIGI